jgi:hypothetical protein
LSASPLGHQLAFVRVLSSGKAQWFHGRRPFPIFVFGLVTSLLALLPLHSTAAEKEKAAEPGKGKAETESTKDVKEPESPSRVKQGAHGEIIVTLDEATQKLMGLATAALEPAQLNPETKAYGRVLDVSSLASLVAELFTAQAASEASQAELKRSRTLAAQNNASQRALQTAEANAARDQAQVESVRLRLTANWGGAIAERQDLLVFVQSLGTLASVLVELDVPPDQPLTNAPTGARIFTLAAGDKALPAQYLGPMPVVDAQMQGRGFLFLVSTNRLGLAPGAAVSAFITLPGEPVSGIVVPRDAIVRFNGATWVYLQTSGTTFQRAEISLDSPLENGWFVRTGLKPQDKIVTVGAQELISEERKGQEAE